MRWLCGRALRACIKHMPEMCPARGYYSTPETPQYLGSARRVHCKRGGGSTNFAIIRRARSFAAAVCSCMQCTRSYSWHHSKDKLHAHTCLSCSMALLSQRQPCTACAQARQQIKEMVWMKASENMMLEALTRLASLHQPLEELLREAPPSGAAAEGASLQRAAGALTGLGYVLCVAAASCRCAHRVTVYGGRRRSGLPVRSQV